jgi:hypothetical protein
MRRSNSDSGKADQSSLLFLDHNAKPIVPKANPVTEAPHAKKFKKKVDSSTLITIKKGKMMPKSSRKMPRVRRKRGDLNIFYRYGSEGVF